MNPIFPKTVFGKTVLIFYLAFAPTLRGILLDYLRSLRSDYALLLQESLTPVLQYLYLDLVRTGVRDHLKGHGFGLSEEISRFSSEICYSLGMCNIKGSLIKKLFFDCLIKVRCCVISALFVSN